MSFEDVIGYVLIFGIFVVGFLPIMSGFIIQAQTGSDSRIAFMLGIVVPFILLAFIVAFFIRIRGEKPFGEW